MAGTIIMPVGDGGLPAATLAKLQTTAREFEAMALGEMLRPMFDTVDSAHGPFGGGDGEAAWRPMMVSEMAKQIARQGGVGIGRAVLDTLIRAQAGEQPDDVSATGQAR
jgi:Rod binding domain-containing protein